MELFNSLVREQITEIDILIDAKLNDYDGEIQKQFASMNNDSWYRFGIEPINSNGKNYTRTNNEVFNDFQKVESALRLGTNESIANLSKKLKEERRRTEKLMFFVTAALVSMIVMVAYITTI